MPGTPTASSISRPSPSRPSQSRAAIFVARLAHENAAGHRRRAWQRCGHRGATSMSGGRAPCERRCPVTTGRQSPPAPAAAPDRQPQPAQRHQHQRADRHGAAPASPRRAGPATKRPIASITSMPQPIRCSGAASSPNGIATTRQRRAPASPQIPSPAWPADCPARRNGWRGRNETCAKGMVARLPTRLVSTMPCSIAIKPPARHDRARAAVPIPPPRSAPPPPRTTSESPAR